VGELIRHCAREAPAMSAPVWAIALEHERRAVERAWLEPGAVEALTGARAAGFATALWTNNAREVTQIALDRFGLGAHLDLVVTRDDMRDLKPDPDGYRVIAEHFGPARDAVVVGDSWVDGLAAAEAGVPFVAYRAPAQELERWKVTPVACLSDLAALPAWLRARVARP
jgi:phosphoglycolate phosphatase